jgi:hypothetical protein
MTEPTVKKTTKKKVVKKKATTSPAKTERPKRAESRAFDRPARMRSIGNFRDTLSVSNMDPEYRYRWVLAATENDKRVFDATRAGWRMVDASIESNLDIGDYAVGKSEKLGSVYRIPATRRGAEEYLYLMRIPEEYAVEVDAWKQEKVDAIDAEITRDRKSHENEETGQYGSTKVEHAIGSTRKRV